MKRATLGFVSLTIGVVCLILGDQTRRPDVVFSIAMVWIVVGACQMLVGLTRFDKWFDERFGR